MNFVKVFVMIVVVIVIGINDNNVDGKLELCELKEKKFKVCILFCNFGKINKMYIILLEVIVDLVDEKGFCM